MIRYSTEPGSPVVEIAVEGHVTDSDLRANIMRLKDDLEVAGKTRIIEIIRQFSGMEPRALWSDFELGIPLSHRVNRVAVVADAAWIRSVTHLGHLFTRAELKVFTPEQIDEAQRWIRAD